MSGQYRQARPRTESKSPEGLLPKHGGYRNLKSFQIAQIAYDVTVRFCDRYVDRFSRTKDQMVQAARSGVQNIAEGSKASGTSKKTELKLTNVARASLEELRLDYEDFLRQRGCRSGSGKTRAEQRLSSGAVLRRARWCSGLRKFMMDIVDNMGIVYSPLGPQSLPVHLSGNRRQRRFSSNCRGVQPFGPPACGSGRNL